MPVIVTVVWSRVQVPVSRRFKLSVWRRLCALLSGEFCTLVISTETVQVPVRRVCCKNALRVCCRSALIFPRICALFPGRRLAIMRWQRAAFLWRQFPALFCVRISAIFGVCDSFLHVLLQSPEPVYLRGDVGHKIFGILSQFLHSWDDVTFHVQQGLGEFGAKFSEPAGKFLAHFF